MPEHGKNAAGNRLNEKIHPPALFCPQCGELSDAKRQFKVKIKTTSHKIMKTLFTTQIDAKILTNSFIIQLIFLFTS